MNDENQDGTIDAPDTFRWRQAFVERIKSEFANVADTEIIVHDEGALSFLSIFHFAPLADSICPVCTYFYRC